jgi:hypothetical protein
MTAANNNFVIDQGANWFVTVVYKNSAGVAIDLTGYTTALQIRDTYADTTTDLSLTSPSGGITITGATGTLAIRATAAQTGALDDSAKYDYDLEITSPSGVVTRLIQGVASVSSQITR